jgi:HD-like signal output (HDOD) protein
MVAIRSVEGPSLAEAVRALVVEGRVALPPLPELADKLLRELRRGEDVGLWELGDAMSSDSALVAAVLRMANSAAFGGLGEVTSIEQAIARLGLRQVTHVVLTVAHRDHYRWPDPERAEVLHALWEHAIASALGARRLAWHEGNPGEAYLAGLLHDVGKLMVLRAVEELERRRKAPRVEHEALLDLMDDLHTTLGGRMLADWHIPESTRAVVHHHHDEVTDPGERLLLRVQVASGLARRIGYHPRADRRLEPAMLPAAQALGLTPADLDELGHGVRSEVEEIRSLL